jgi:hypothetical protein
MATKVDLVKQDTDAATGYVTDNEQFATENKECFKENRDARNEWYGDRVDRDNFYHNKHYEDSEETEIIKRGQAPLAINVVYAIVKQMISLLTSNDPVWDVSPVTEADKSYTYLMRGLMDATWYMSKGSRQLSMIAKDMTVVGVGYGMVSPRMVGNNMIAHMQHIPYHHVYVSPDTREIDYQDADNLVISKMSSYRQIAELLNRTVDEVKEMADDSDTNAEDEEPVTKYTRYTSPMTRDTKRYARVIQRLSMETVDCYDIIPIGDVAILRKTYFSMTPQLDKLESEGKIRIEKRRKKVVAKYISVGKYGERYYLPIETYNLVPFIDEFTGNPYPLGEVDFLYGLQRALNKFILLAILNATLSNNMRMMAPEGSIDKDMYEQSYAIPGSLTTYKWEAGMPEPKQFDPKPLGSEFFAFPKTLISMMEYITGIFGVVQGNPEGAPRTASGLMSLQNYGGQKIKLLGRNLNDALTSLGDVGIALFQNFAPYNQTISYFKDGTPDPQTVQYNQLSVQNGKVAVQNDISNSQFKTRVIIHQNYGSERQMKAAMLGNLAAQTRSPALIGPILKLADIPEADKIAQDIDAINQAQSTIEQMQKSIQDLTTRNTTLEREVLNMAKQVDFTQFAAQLDIILGKIKNELGAEVATEMSQFKADLQTQLQQATMDIQQKANTNSQQPSE